MRHSFCLKRERLRVSELNIPNAPSIPFPHHHNVQTANQTPESSDYRNDYDTQVTSKA